MSDSFVCEVCGMVALDERGLKIHKYWAHTRDQSQTAECEICHKVCKSDRALKVHMSRMHQTKEVVERPEVVSFDQGFVVVSDGRVKEPKKESIENTSEIPENVKPVPISLSSEVHTLNPLELGIREIPEGSILNLQGMHYVVSLERITGAERAENIKVTVNQRWLASDNKVYLKAKSEGGVQEWVILESDVLTGRGVQLISLKKKDVPKNYIPELPKDSVVTELSEEEIKEKETYLEALKAYASARDKKIEAEKEYKEVDNSVRKIILDYVEKYGVESSEGAHDRKLILENYKVQWTFSEGAVYTVRNEDAILQYLISNGWVTALKHTVNWEMWDLMKKNGIIPPDFIQNVEEVKKEEDQRKLLVEKIS